MTILWYTFTCDCGCKAPTVKIGVSSLGELVATWTCAKCKAAIMTKMPLEDVVKDIPQDPVRTFNQEDKKLLALMHIKGEEDVA